LDAPYIILIISFITGLIGFLLKQALSDRDKRISAAEAQGKLLFGAIRSLQTTTAVCTNRHETTDRDMKQVLRAMERLDEKLDRLQ
jgi:hypothetical protein